MERVMELSLVDCLHRSNSKLRILITRAGEALAGRTTFGVEEVRAITEPVAEVEPILAQAARLRTTMPDLDQELLAYTQNLGEMQTALDRVRCVLLARCASVEAQRGHLDAVGLWAAAWQQTQSSP